MVFLYSILLQNVWGRTKHVTFDTQRLLGVGLVCSFLLTVTSIFPKHSEQFEILGNVLFIRFLAESYMRRTIPLWYLSVQREAEADSSCFQSKIPYLPHRHENDIHLVYILIPNHRKDLQALLRYYTWFVVNRVKHALVVLVVAAAQVAERVGYLSCGWFDPRFLLSTCCVKKKQSHNCSLCVLPNERKTRCQ